MDGTASSEAVQGSPEELLARVQELQEAVDGAGVSVPRDLAEELVSAVVQMYGAGLERIIAALHRGGEVGEQIAAGLADDDLVAMLLLIHDLHPVTLADRVQAAL